MGLCTHMILPFKNGTLWIPHTWSPKGLDTDCEPVVGKGWLSPAAAKNKAQKDRQDVGFSEKTKRNKKTITTPPKQVINLTTQQRFGKLTNKLGAILGTSIRNVKKSAKMLNMSCTHIWAYMHINGREKAWCAAVHRLYLSHLRGVLQEAGNCGTSGERDPAGMKVDSDISVLLYI